MKTEFRVENLVAQPGEKVSGFINIVGADFGIPVTIICGKHEGENLLVCGGLHNAEYVGIQAAMEIADTIDPNEVHGNVMIIRLLNRTGFEHRTMSLVYEDGKNLNRIFPGKACGTLGDRIAYTMETVFFSKTDYFIDLHCGDGFEALESFVYCQGNAPAEVVKKSREMGELAHCDYLTVSSNGTGGAYNHAGSIGIPAILLERGCNSTWCQDLVKEDVHDVLNMMRGLGILEGEAHRHHVPIPVTPMTYKDAPVSGCWYPTKNTGETFRKGECLGTIRDYFGKELHRCEAEYDGIMLYETISLCIQKDTPMVAYGPWDFEKYGARSKSCVVCGNEHEHGHHHDHIHDHTHQHAFHEPM